MDRKHTIEYCKELIDLDSNHTYWKFRNVVSRAYYSVFYLAEKRLKKELNWRITASKGGVHDKLYSRLHGYPENTISDSKKLEIEMLKKNISDLKKLRTDADYKLHLDITKELAEFSICESEAISKKLEML